MYYNENRGNEPRDRRKNQGGIKKCIIVQNVFREAVPSRI
jgi:hypothetical protein